MVGVSISITFCTLISSCPVVELASTFLLTAHVPEGYKAVIYPLNSLNSTTRPAWLSSLREARHADDVRLFEIDISNGAPVTVTVSQKASEKVKRRDWLTLLLRESLGATLPLASGLPSSLS
jgi:hypothetical protein